jgi:6,7-dimethyl-8-ribityllumazine synthase
MAGKSRGGAPKSSKIEAHILLVEAPYYDDVSRELATGAIAELEAHGCTFDRVEVPGALEIPQVLSQLLVGPHRDMDAPDEVPYDGAIALGCVIRGETSHYDIVCNNANHWLYELAINTGFPVGNAILTVDTKEQALARARGGRDGKGGDAARAVLKLIEVGRTFAARGA